jgi:uncharacterized surface protein with fasciclin (FAS1) repeats
LHIVHPFFTSTDGTDGKQVTNRSYKMNYQQGFFASETFPEFKVGGGYGNKYKYGRPQQKPKASIAEVVTQGPYAEILNRILGRVRVSSPDSFGAIAGELSKPNRTLFMPTNDAFKDLLDRNPGLENALVSNPSLLVQVLTYHLVDASVKFAAVADLIGKSADKKCVSVTALDKNSIRICLGGPAQPKGPNVPPVPVLVNDAQLKMIDFATTNGSVVHVIDKVLLSPTVLAALKK